MPIEIRDALNSLTQGQEIDDKQTRFWYRSMIGQRASSQIINGTVTARLNRVESYMKKNGLPVYRPWLMQLVKWHTVRGGRIQRDVIALKYMLLEDGMKKGLEWTEKLDAHVEGLAKDAYEAHK